MCVGVCGPQREKRVHYDMLASFRYAGLKLVKINDSMCIKATSNWLIDDNFTELFLNMMSFVAMVTLWLLGL